jgi:hypothetical protein
MYPLDLGHNSLVEERLLTHTTRTVVVACLILSLCAPLAQAQSVLGTVFKNKYKLKSVACETCHIKTENKDEHLLNDFGKILAKMTEGKQMTKRINDNENADEATKDKLKEELTKEFMEVLKKIDEMKAPSGKTYAEVIKAGEMEGIKTRK